MERAEAEEVLVQSVEVDSWKTNRLIGPLCHHIEKDEIEDGDVDASDVEDHCDDDANPHVLLRMLVMIMLRKLMMSRMMMAMMLNLQINKMMFKMMTTIISVKLGRR